MFTEPGDHGLGRSRGGFTTKLHLAVEQVRSPCLRGHGRAARRLAAVLARAEQGRPRVRPNRVRADKAYAFRKNRAYLRRHGIRRTIPDKTDQAHNCRKLGSRGRPARFAPVDYRERHVVEC
ncbi:hypothetical protein [Streptomyces sp. NPDC015414]|uniref:hypothetical protein n=1 Tax=Streptomyces sp. NPDC015414 TaxID=3364957 RepID=UPI00370135FD